MVLKQFELNRAGRDFVVGDVHGCFHLLAKALKAERFNPATDRCFAVGDLIDRGPYSEHLLHWLRQPWFHTCLGNHEEMLLHTDPDSSEGKEWFKRYGGKWWLRQDEEERAKIRTALERLSIAMEIETQQGHVGIVHAEVPEECSWQLFIQRLQQNDLDTRREALWGRRRILGSINGPVSGIDFVVCGHTITPHRQVMEIDNVWFIDCGAYLEDGKSQLTLLPLEMLFKKAPDELAH